MVHEFVVNHPRHKLVPRIVEVALSREIWQLPFRDEQMDHFIVWKRAKFAEEVDERNSKSSCFFFQEFCPFFRICPLW